MRLSTTQGDGVECGKSSMDEGEGGGREVDGGERRRGARDAPRGAVGDVLIRRDVLDSQLEVVLGREVDDALEDAGDGASAVAAAREAGRKYISVASEVLGEAAA